jgi:Pentapeptide repeats (8 copies)
MSNPAQDVFDRIERSIGELISDMNTAAGAARNAWLAFMALLAFFVIALAGVSHKDLLVETPIELPLLQVKVPQRSFALYGPLILLLVHLSLLLQHVTLARKVKDVHDRLTKHEGNGSFRQHRLRTLVHSYTVAQAVAGPWRSRLLGFFMHAMNWATLGILPVLVLLNFQITFLPWHDETATWLHRAYLVADVMLLVVLGVLLRAPDRGFFSGLAAGFRDAPVSSIGSIVMAMLAIFFSLLVATIPDEKLDKAASALWSVPVPIGATAGPAVRRAFLPTAVLFEGITDEIQGRPDSLFSRNIVVINTSMAAPINPEPDEPSINLRGRDLKYATLDRSDFRRADLTGADLTGASLQQTGLIKARLTKAKLRGADLRNAGMISTFVRGADMEGARICAEQRGIFLISGSSNPDEIKGLVKEPCPKDR